MMIKEAIEYLVKLGNIRTMTIAGQTFSTQAMHLMPEPTAKTITVSSLSGLVEYLECNFDKADSFLLHVASPTQVVAYSVLNVDRAREVLVQAKADLPQFHFGSWYDAEEFNIALQSMFLDAGNRADVLKLVGNIKDENVATFGDDGISQQVTAKTGVATVSNVKVPNPVHLFPFRTFVEVEQPQSSFVFRMKNGPNCALFEADGGAWKNAAMVTIREYLQESLKDLLFSKKIVLIA